MFWDCWGRHGGSLAMTPEGQGTAVLMLANSCMATLLGQPACPLLICCRPSLHALQNIIPLARFTHAVHCQEAAGFDSWMLGPSEWTTEGQRQRVGNVSWPVCYSTWWCVPVGVPHRCLLYSGRALPLQKIWLTHCDLRHTLSLPFTFLIYFAHLNLAWGLSLPIFPLTRTSQVP